MRILNGIMLLVFLLAMAVQYNDPSGLLWALWYGISAGFTVAALFNIYTPLAPLTALPYFGGALYLLPAWSPWTLADLLSQPKMINDDVELAREALGLAICGVWMLVLGWVWYRRRNAVAPAE